MTFLSPDVTLTFLRIHRQYVSFHCPPEKSEVKVFFAFMAVNNPSQAYIAELIVNHDFFPPFQQPFYDKEEGIMEIVMRVYNKNMQIFRLCNIFLLLPCF